MKDIYAMAGRLREFICAKIKSEPRIGGYNVDMNT